MNGGGSLRSGIGKTTSKTVETLRGWKLVNGERILPISWGGRGVVTDVVNTAGAARFALLTLFALFALLHAVFGYFWLTWGGDGFASLKGGVIGLLLYRRTQIRCYQVERISQEVF